MAHCSKHWEYRSAICSWQPALWREGVVRRCLVRFGIIMHRAWAPDQSARVLAQNAFNNFRCQPEPSSRTAELNGNEGDVSNKNVRTNLWLASLWSACLILSCLGVGWGRFHSANVRPTLIEIDPRRWKSRCDFRGTLTTTYSRYHCINIFAKDRRILLVDTCLHA